MIIFSPRHLAPPRPADRSASLAPTSPHVVVRRAHITLDVNFDVSVDDAVDRAIDGVALERGEDARPASSARRRELLLARRRRFERARARVARRRLRPQRPMGVDEASVDARGIACGIVLGRVEPRVALGKELRRHHVHVRRPRRHLRIKVSLPRPGIRQCRWMFTP